MAKNFNWFVICQGVTNGRWCQAIKDKILTVIVGVFECTVLLSSVVELTTDMFKLFTLVDCRKSDVW